MKLVWSREEYVACCSRKEKRATEWFKAGIWKLRGMRKGSEKGRSYLWSKEENTAHIHYY
jgi:hypothetical protein